MGLRKLLGLCDHEFHKVRQGTIEETFCGHHHAWIYWSIHQCIKCGKYKKRKTKV